MKDYAKVINQSKEIHGQQQVRQTLAHSAVQKTKEHKEAAPAKKGSGFFTVVALFILVAILFAVYRQYVHHKELALATTTPTTASADASQATQQPSSPQFDFYTVLPSGGTPGSTPTSSSATPSSTNAPGVTTPPTTDATATTPATTPAATTTTSVTTPTPTTPAPSTGQYYLNAGAFSNEADAQQTLSQLLLLGVQASIKSVQENGAPSYQVLVGPFDDPDTMNVVKQQLIAHQIQASVVQQ